MQPAYHLIRDDEDTGEEEYDLVDCTFHPVRPTGRMVPLPAAETEDAPPAQGNVPAGQACPKAGFWSTPAQTDSRRYFKVGEIMPSLKSDWGQNDLGVGRKSERLTHASSLITALQ